MTAAGFVSAVMLLCAASFAAPETTPDALGEAEALRLAEGIESTAEKRVIAAGGTSSQTRHAAARRAQTGQRYMAQVEAALRPDAPRWGRRSGDKPAGSMQHEQQPRAPRAFAIGVNRMDKREVRAFLESNGDPQAARRALIREREHVGDNLLTGGDNTVSLRAHGLADATRRSGVASYLKGLSGVSGW